MATFQYRAYTHQGVVTVGTIVADGVEAATNALYSSGLTPFEPFKLVDGRQSDPDRPARNGSLWQIELGQSNKFGLKELAAFTMELASLVNSGLPLDEAFRVIGSPGAPAKTIRLANGLLKDVLSGAQLSESMSKRPDIFPSDYRAIVGAGEVGGAIGPALRQIAELLARRLETKNKISSALVYPVVLILMSLLSVAVIIFVLVPSLAPVFTDAGLPLPGILKTFSDLQDDWVGTGLSFGVALLLATFAWRAISRSPNMLLACHRMMCSLPVAGKLIQIRAAAGFTRAMGTLLGARAPLMSALQTAQTLVGNRHLAALYATAIRQIPEGTPLSRALSIGLMPPSALRLVAVGEETGQLGTMLLQVAAVLEGDLQRQIERMVGLLTPILTIAIGGGVGALIMQVMRAILSINDLAFQ